MRTFIDSRGGAMLRLKHETPDSDEYWEAHVGSLS